MSKRKVVKKKSRTSVVKQRNRLRNKGIVKPKKRIYGKVEDKFDGLEVKYESSQSAFKRDYNTKMLLPIKTKTGIERRFAEVSVIPIDEEKDVDEPKAMEMESSEPVDEDHIWLNRALSSTEIDIREPISMAQLYARREEMVQKFKFRIGLLSSSLLENPEIKVGNIKSLLEIMDEKKPELQITVKKLVIISLMEIFKDLLPAYQIKHPVNSDTKLKKVTQQLLGYESQLLRGYQDFLKRIEKLAECLRKKKGNHRFVPAPEKGLAKLAVKCLCELLISHSYFNYAENIIHLLTIYLDNPEEDVRKMVEDCYKTIFHDDKRGYVSLVIVRRINYLVKTRAHSVHCEALSVLLYLRIHNVNFDQEKEDEIKNKKLMNKRQKLITMSKKERKRKKELAKLDKEMLEAKAEENKQTKQQHMTEIVKTVFLIYFRILKRSPRSILLNTTLEGLAKFAHCINLEFYQDLVNVLDNLLENESLKVREQLYCIKTVFIILSGQGDVLNIDPLYFFTHLYRIMLQVHTGKTEDCIDILLTTLETVLIDKRKKMTTQRLLSFAKRLASVALHLSQEGMLGALNILKTVFQLSRAVDLLLDVESTYGQGMYNPELNEPEYSNAGSTALWELCSLRRHYHPIVKKMSDHVSYGAPTSGEGSLPPQVAKKNNIAPSLPPPNKKLGKLIKVPDLNNEFLDECNKFFSNVPEYVNFSKIIE